MRVNIAWTFHLLIILSTQAKSQSKDFEIVAPYHGYFKGFKHRDSVTFNQAYIFGPLLSSNKDLEVIGFRWTSFGTCLGASMIQFRDVNGNTIPEGDFQILNSLRHGSLLIFENIRVRDKTGIAYTIKGFYYTIRRLNNQILTP